MATGADAVARPPPPEPPATSLRPLLVVPQRRRPRVCARIGGRGRSWFDRLRRTRSRPPSRPFVDASTAGGGRSCWCPRRCRCPRPRRRSSEAFGERVAMFVGGDKRSRYRTWLDIARRAVRRRGGNAAGRVRARCATSGRSWCPARAIRPIARIGRRTTTSAMSRWSGPGSAGPCACSPRSVRRRRRARSASWRSRRRRGGGRRWRSCGPVRRDARLDSSARSERRTAASSSRRCRDTGSRRCVVRAAARRHARRAAARFDRKRARFVASCARRRGDARIAGRRISGSGAAAPNASKSGRRRSPPSRSAGSRREAGPGLPRAEEILVGGPESVRDLGPGDLDLVAILDADLAERRPGLASRERALATWMEAVGMGAPLGQSDRAGRPAGRPRDPSVGARQPGSVPRGRGSATRGGGVPGRVAPCSGSSARMRSKPELADVDPITMLVSSVGEQTVCLLALEPGRVDGFGRTIRDLAARDIVERVEAEPHL